MPPTSSSSSSTSSSSCDVLPSIARIWVVRHGERLDEADRLAWYQQCVSTQNHRWHDPPLTDRGHKQAAHAASLLLRFISTSPSARYQNSDGNNSNNNNHHNNKLINDVENRLEKEMIDDIEAGMIGFNRNASVKAVDREDQEDTESKEESKSSNENKLTVSTIYSSPLLRVMQTAQMFSSAYQLPIQPVPALAAPAAAIQERHIEACDIFLPHKELEKRCPHINTILPWTPVIQSDDYQFIQWCESLIHQSPHQRDFLFITHREAIRDLMRHCGRVLKIVPYCQIVQFDYDRETKKWTPNEFITPPQNC